MTTKWSIWDLDNCLADDKWRQPLINFTVEGAERYREYDSQMLHDKPHHVTEFKFMQRFAQPVFFTGRRERWRALTTEWVQRHLAIEHPIVFMRPDDDEGTPVQVKRDMLCALLNMHRVPVFDIVGAFDDLPSIISMYHAFGIGACQLAIHHDTGAYQPRDLTTL
jgi:hypothetical protein